MSGPFCGTLILIGSQISFTKVIESITFARRSFQYFAIAAFPERLSPADQMYTALSAYEFIQESILPLASAARSFLPISIYFGSANSEGFIAVSLAIFVESVADAVESAGLLLQANRMQHPAANVKIFLILVVLS